MIHRIRIYSHDAHVFTCCLQQFAVLFCFLLLCLRKSRSSSELRIVPLHLLHGVPSGALLWQRSHVLEMRSPACSQDLMGSMGAVEVTYKERSYLGKVIHPKIHWTKTCGCQISQKERAHTSLQANIVSRCFKERTGSLQHNDHSKACACTQCDAAKQNLLASIAEALIWIAMLAPAVTL